MARLIVIIDKLVNLYIYFVVMACFLGCVPNINPNYPLFHYIFKFAGFYIIPPFWGISLSPAVVLVVMALISLGLRKIYIKYFEKEQREVIVLSQEDFIKSVVNQINDSNEETAESPDYSSKEDDSDD